MRRLVEWFTVLGAAAAIAIAPCLAQAQGQQQKQGQQQTQAAATATPIIYPAKGQSAEKQEKDKTECYAWAQKQTGYDPLVAAQQAATASQGTGSSDRTAVKGAAKGAAAGAAIGAIAGDAGKGAAAGAAGGGMVTVVMNGAKQIQSLKIDPEAVSKDDVEMLQDLILAAINDAHRKADEAMSQQMSGMMGGLKIPGLS